MKNKQLIIYGVGQFAEYIHYIFQNDSDYEVIAFCIEKEYQQENNNMPLPVLTFENLKEQFPLDSFDLFIAVGNDQIRERLFKTAKQKGFNLANYIASETITYPDLEYGENIFISAGSGIQPFVKIEDNCMLLAAKIGHHSVIKKNSLISKAIIGSGVIIGKNSFIGINASIKPNLTIGNYNVIGMGCVITSSTKDGEVYSAPSARLRKITYEQLNNIHLRKPNPQ